MRVGVCALGSVSGDTGGRTYLVNFARVAGTAHRNHQFVFFMSDGQEHGLQLDFPNILPVTVPHSHRHVFLRVMGEHLILPSLMRRYGIDAMYYPNNFSSFSCPVPYVLAIRSMLYYHHPRTIGRFRRLYRTAMTPHSARGAHSIISPSHDIKADVCRFTGVAPEKIHVINHGVDSALFSTRYPPEEYERTLTRLRIVPPFILYTSALWRYKNHDKLILAFKRLVDDRSIPHQLVLVGKGVNSERSYERSLRDLIVRLGLEHRVVMAGYLDHHELKYLYQRCDVFAFPSSYESFGNPLFEAMAAGVPIVSSNVHSFPEMAGDAALFVNPLDTQALSDGLYRCITDEALRAELVAAGRKRVAQFSWDNCVRETLAVLEEAAKSTKRGSR